MWAGCGCFLSTTREEQNVITPPELRCYLPQLALAERLH